MVPFNLNKSRIAERSLQLINMAEWGFGNQDILLMPEILWVSER